MGGARDGRAELQHVQATCRQLETLAAIDDVVHRLQCFLADPHWFLLRKTENSLKAASQAKPTSASLV